LAAPGHRPVGQFRGPTKPEPAGEFRSIHDAHYNIPAPHTARDNAMAQDADRRPKSNAEMQSQVRESAAGRSSRFVTIRRGVDVRSCRKQCVGEGRGLPTGSG
jgi:hypothetical protein